MKHIKNKIISAYVKGDVNTPDYYRIHQYLQCIHNIRVYYHMMLPNYLYHKYVPIRKNNILIVITLYIIVYFRTILSLFKDLLFPPEYLIINRRIMPRKALFPTWIIIKSIHKRGRTCIIWDFDDDIVSMGECTHGDFQKLSQYAHHILVTHRHLASLIDDTAANKIHILPTTDGDMYRLFHDQAINEQRLMSLKKEINLVWVATSANLAFLEYIIPQLDETAGIIKERLNKTLKLKVVCNAPLIHQCRLLTVENIPWSKDAAIGSLKASHIGIMPLLDTKIARGKGGFKLVQYMSIGLPCIGTDVGFNNTVIDSSYGRLIPANDLKQWTSSIIELADEQNWESYSQNAYKTWERKFSFEKNLDFWKRLLFEKSQYGTESYND